MSLSRNFLALGLVFVGLFPLVWPLFWPGFFLTDDGNDMVARLYAFHQTLKTGQFPVRFLEHLNHGYGYPVLNFLYPLPFYLGELVHLLGFGFVDSVKILFFLGFLLGAVFMYLWIKSKWGRLAGVVAAVFFSYAPYRIFDVYQRGSLGESTAFIFLPLIFWAIDELVKTKGKKWLLILSLAHAGLITSHNSLAFIFTLIIYGYVWLKILTAGKKTEPFLISSLDFARDVHLSFFISILLSAFFWLPAIFELSYTRASIVEVADFRRYFLDTTNWVPLVGWLSLGIFLTAAVQIVKVKNREGGLLVLATVGALFLASGFSTRFWEILPLPRLVQFPWRFLAVVSFGTAYLSGYLVSLLRKTWLVIGLVLVIIIFSSSQIKVNHIFYPEEFYLTNDSTTTVKNEYLPVYVKNEFLKNPGRDLEIISGNGRIITNDLVDVKETVKLRVSRVYYPGWKVFVDGREAEIDYKSEGFLDVTVPKGTHNISWRFTETPLRKISNTLSIIGLGIVAILIMWTR